jgi:transmembrane sensor
MKPIADELLIRYLLDEATVAERGEIEIWLKADPANKAYFNQFKWIWDSSKALGRNSTVSESDAWSRFQQRIAETPQKKTRLINFSGAQWLRAAALLLIVFSAALSFNLYRGGWGSGDLIVLQSGNKVLKQTLPDGSVITLNKFAKLTYPEDFNGDTRAITLDGEAFFDVAPDKQHPFIITANQSSITVLGTSFNVATSAARTEVIVETGIVEVSKNDHNVKLLPDEKATVTGDSDAPVKEKSEDALHNYYRTQEFICNGTPLWRLTDVLSQAYGVEIIIANPQLRNLPLTTTFRNEPLDNILVVIGETFGIHIEKKGNIITLR